MEEWKHVNGYEGLYEASNHGRIRSVDRLIIGEQKSWNFKAKVLTPLNNGSGYMGVCLRKNGQTKRLYIHRLVLQSFCPSDIYLEVNHKDGRRNNNFLSNLEWVTSAENKQHMYKVLKRAGANKGKFGALNWLSKPVEMYNLNGEKINEFAGVMEASRILNINEASIRNCIYKKSKTCNGHVFYYK